MYTQDVVSIFLIIFLVIVSICIVFTTYYFAQALKAITRLSDDLDDTAQNLKNKIQLKALAAIPALLVAIAGRVIKRKRG